MRLKSVGMGYFLAIPDVISILNLVFGFLAILMVIGNHLTYASLCILVAVVFDSVDGWVSRKLNRDDKFGFGKNIDSLADIVSFGVYSTDASARTIKRYFPSDETENGGFDIQTRLEADAPTALYDTVHTTLIFPDDYTGTVKFFATLLLF